MEGLEEGRRGRFFKLEIQFTGIAPVRESFLFPVGSRCSDDVVVVYYYYYHDVIVLFCLFAVNGEQIGPFW